MSVLYLQPSQIRYSQDSINNYFDSRSIHSNTLIGNTLDDLCEGRCHIDDIIKISVVNMNGKWFTADNRRLWVFKHLERLKKCTVIPVNLSYYIPDHKFTTLNDGASVIVRRNPGGRWHSKPTPTFNEISSTNSGLSERYTTHKHSVPSRLIQYRPSTPTYAEQNALWKPPNRDEIQFTAKRSTHDESKEPEIQAPRFQVHNTLHQSFRIQSYSRSSDIQNAPIIPIAADNHSNDVHMQLDEPKERTHDKKKYVRMAPESKGDIYNTGNLDCCLCVIL
ncbi:hypothetical protein ACJMK2_034256 [Sinanodonta woodiana]|uniref:Uncharacterized protein n=1 Tax=Sinanodonta woodiana TaxID=1069815 RepID=A0ABD3WR09_SINWO